MPVTLVQAAMFSSAATYAANHQTLTTTCVLASVTPGNFLCAARWTKVQGSRISNPGGAPLTMVGVTGYQMGNGVSWVWGQNPPQNPRGSFDVEYLPILNTLTAVTFIARANNSTGASNTLSADVLMMEFSGVGTSPKASNFNDGSSSVPDPGALTNTVACLCMSIFGSDPATGSNISAGSGYTMVGTASAATIGQLQYATAAAGTVAAAFSGASQGTWGAAAVSFNITSATAAAVSWNSQPILLGF